MGTDVDDGLTKLVIELVSIERRPVLSIGTGGDVIGFRGGGSGGGGTCFR